jgi:Na+-translocating ferredoxin:NAD+ oxidoreductase RnfA subunit
MGFGVFVGICVLVGAGIDVDGGVGRDVATAGVQAVKSKIVNINKRFIKSHLFS